jgi:hypothetical protein
MHASHCHLLLRPLQQQRGRQSTAIASPWHHQQQRQLPAARVGQRHASLAPGRCR